MLTYLRPWLASTSLGLALLVMPGAARADDKAEKAACIDAAESAQKLRTSSKLIDARASLLRCARDVCPKAVRDDCNAWMAEVDRDLPSVIVRARSPKDQDLDGAISIDGNPVKAHVDGAAVTVDPGPHVVKLTPSDPAWAETESRVIVAAGEKNRIVTLSPLAHGTTVTPTPTREGGSTRWVGWTLGAVGLATTVAFVAVQVVAQGEYADMKDSACGKALTCGADVLDPIRAKFQASGVLLGVSAALLVSSVVWLIVDHPKAAANVAVGPLGVAGRF